MTEDIQHLYRAEIGGHSWKQGPTADFASIQEARCWAEEYGTTADWCTIKDTKGRIVAARDFF